MLYEAKCPYEGRKTIWRAYTTSSGGVGSECESCKGMIPKPSPKRDPTTGKVSEADLICIKARKVAEEFNKGKSTFDWSKTRGGQFRNRKGQYASATTV